MRIGVYAVNVADRVSVFVNDGDRVMVPSAEQRY